MIIDGWSREKSFLHDRDPRAKLIALLTLLILLSISGSHGIMVSILTLAGLLVVSLATPLPTFALIVRSTMVLPFCVVFGLSSWLSGDAMGAARLILRTYASGFAALLFVASTPLPALSLGLEKLGAPRFLIAVVQFLYRYLFLLSEEAQYMRAASWSRGGLRGRPGFHAAAGALSSLFARSHARATQIHHAMLSRGFNGTLPVTSPGRFTSADVALVLFTLSFALIVETIAT